MAFLNRNKVVSGGTVERRHINLLRICINASVILAFAVIVLQVLSLFFPPVQEEIGLAFGAARRSFRLTPVSAAAFLSIPAIAIVLIWVYLKGYFKRNTHGSHLRIPYLDKHPRKKTAKYFHYAFIAVMLLASAVLGVINFIKAGRIDPHTRWDQLMALIPVVVMVFVLVGFAARLWNPPQLPKRIAALFSRSPIQGSLRLSGSPGLYPGGLVPCVSVMDIPIFSPSTGSRPRMEENGTDHSMVTRLFSP